MHAAGRTSVGLNLPMIAVGVLAGCALIHLLPALFSPWWLLTALPLPVLLYRGQKTMAWSLLAALLMAGLTLDAAGKRMQQRLSLPETKRYEEVTLRGWLAELPESGETSLRLGVDTEHGQRLRLSWYGPPEPAAPLLPGQCWDMTLRLRPPRGMANPHVFDYEAWLLRKGISATGYVREASRCPGHDRPGLNAWRGRLALRLRDRLPGSPAAGLVSALLLGERSGIDDQQWDVLRRTGTSHLMAISGLHVGLMATAVYWLLKLLAAWFPTLTRRRPAQQWAALGAIPAATGYALLSGFDLPAQRACIMVVIALLALASGRMCHPASVLAIALICVLLHDQFAPLAPGFWLSFAAVGWILYLFAGRIGRAGKTRSWLWLQIGLCAALAPLCLVWFNEASWVAPLANLALIPFMALYLPLLLLAGLPVLMLDLPSPLLWKALAVPLDLAWRGLELLDGVTAGIWSVPTPSLWLTVAACLGLALLLAPRGLPARLCGVVLVIPLLWPARADIPEGQVEVTVFDVGQGLATLVRTADHNLLYDAGPRYRSGFDTGEAVVVPGLKALGVDRLDLVLISHDDIDHRGGLEAVRRGIYIQSELNTGRAPCTAGQYWHWDGVDFEILHPRPATRWNDNNGSCVLRVATGGQQLLLTGDIERAAEQALLAREPESVLRSAVLIAPHHGSASSSSAAFVRAVQPAEVIVAAAHRNRWGFPRQEVMQRYRSAGARLWQTGSDGAIRIRLGNELRVPEVDSWRSHAPRYWRSF